MNRFLTFPGLQPIYLGDIDFLQNSVKEAFLMLLKGLTGQDKPKCILVKASANKDGVICFDGEIMPYKAYTEAVLGTLCYKIEFSYSGERTFKDGTVNKCYENRYVVGYSDPQGTVSEYQSSNFPMLTDILLASTKLKHGSKTYVESGLKTVVKYSSMGDLYHVEGTIAVEGTKQTTVLASNLILDIPGAASIDGERYFVITAEINGVMVTIPAKMTLRYESATSCSVNITINDTVFTSGTIGSFAFTITL